MERLLRYLNDELEIMFPMTRKAAYKRFYHPEILSIEDYFPSELGRVASRLERRGLVEIEEKDGYKLLRIKDRGRVEVLKYDWADFRVKRAGWDGKWRLVFFDITEKEKKKREELRGYLKRLGMEQMQESVYVSPYDIMGEVRYLREVLGVPHGVKLAVLEWIDNGEELKEIFELK